MSYPQTQQEYSADSYVVNPNDYEPPECPPENVYVLTFEGIESIGLGKAFDGKEPKVQMVLNFKIDAAPGSEDADWNDLDIRGWFSPLVHYDVNLPDYGGRVYTEPNLYKLVRAMNGGNPISLPIERDPSGRSYYAAYDAAQVVSEFVGKRFRSVIGPSASGWPRLKGDPMPLVAAGARSRRGAAAPTTEPNTAADEATAAALFSGEPNF